MRHLLCLLLALALACGSTRSHDAATSDRPTPPPPAARSSQLDPAPQSASRPASQPAGAADVLAAADEDAQPSLLGELSWLVGTWRLSRPAGFIEETWLPAAGGAMLGVGRTVTDDRMTSFEFLRIDERGDRLVYVAQPQGRAATEFEMLEIDVDRVHFENPDHDFPKWIRYERTRDGSVRATIGADAREIQFAYRRLR